METTNNKNLATFTHLSILSQYCIPFGNFIFPILIWSTKKDKSEFIDFHGKQALNFQLSMFFYSLLFAAIAIPILIFTFFSSVPMSTFLNGQDLINNHFTLENVTGFAILAIVALLFIIGLKVAEFFLIIYASIKTSNGEKFEYPLTITFIK